MRDERVEKDDFFEYSLTLQDGGRAGERKAKPGPRVMPGRQDGF
jgi:hypothetical protein